MPSIDEGYSALEAELSSLADRYLAQYVPANPEDGPDKFEYDVKAYSILAHAAFEEFAELISELLMISIVDGILTKKITVGTACFLMSYKMTIDHSEDKDDPVTCFSHVRLALDKCKEAHSKTLKDNNGFSLKYLRKLLTPVGINIPTGPELDSLQKLADARGTFAHSRGKSAQYGEYKKATKVLPPEEAAQIVTDCLSICGKIKEQAAAAMA